MPSIFGPAPSTGRHAEHDGRAVTVRRATSPATAAFEEVPERMLGA